VGKGQAAQEDLAAESINMKDERMDQQTHLLWKIDSGIYFVPIALLKNIRYANEFHERGEISAEVYNYLVEFLRIFDQEAKERGREDLLTSPISMYSEAFFHRVIRSDE